MNNFVIKRKNIEIWFPHWLKEQLEYAYIEIETGRRANNEQVISLKHIIQNHVNKDEKYLATRIKESNLNIATTFICSPRELYELIFQVLFKEQNISEIMDWICDDLEYNETYWLIVDVNPYKAIGYNRNKETSTITEIKNLKHFEHILKISTYLLINQTR